LLGLLVKDLLPVLVGQHVQVLLQVSQIVFGHQPLLHKLILHVQQHIIYHKLVLVFQDHYQQDVSLV